MWSYCKLCKDLQIWELAGPQVKLLCSSKFESVHIKIILKNIVHNLMKQNGAFDVTCSIAYSYFQVDKDDSSFK